MTASRFIPLFLAVVVAAAACAPATRAPVPEGGPGADTPAAAVERFLRLVEDEDYIGMGWVFGTESGPIMQRDPQADVERRMYAIALILAHGQFAIQREAPVPGRIGSAVRVTVELSSEDESYTVPFVAVRGPRDRWLVEQVDLEAVTGRGRDG